MRFKVIETRIERQASFNEVSSVGRLLRWREFADQIGERGV